MMSSLVKLFYTKDGETTAPVHRLLEAGDDTICRTMRLLIEGNLTYEEREEGFITEFPHPNFKLQECNLEHGTLTLKFSEVFGFTTGGATRVVLLASQIEETALQFHDVKRVVFVPETLFQP